MSMIIIRPALLAAFGAAAIFATPAFADSTEAPQATVRFGDLDLNSDTGVATLNRRISVAAGEVCGSFNARDLHALALAKKCRSIALESAAPQVQVAINAARSGQAYAENGVRVKAAR
jgi:UrcA family protein